jgi:hypothetical protein
VIPDPIHHPSKPLIPFQNPKAVHAVAAGQIEQLQGRDHFVVAPALEAFAPSPDMAVQGLPEAHPVYQVQVEKKTRQRRKTALAFFNFIREWKRPLRHAGFTSVVMVSFAGKHHIRLISQGQRGFFDGAFRLEEKGVGEKQIRKTIKTRFPLDPIPGKG